MRALHLVLLACLPALAGCWAKTQRFPGPMPADTDPLPPGAKDLYPAGIEEVVVTRLADPVFLRRPGEASSFPLYHYRKQERVNAGSWVFCGAGGRVEVLYPEGRTITLFGRGAGVVGSESRGEPMFVFQEVDRAELHLDEGQQVRLVGGAVLSADDGPVHLEHRRDEVLRVTNRSLGVCRIAYREEVFLLDPAEVVDLPLLDVGTGPLEDPPDFRRLHVGERGLPLRVRGEVEVREDPRGARLVATGEHEVVALGLRLRLDPGDEVLLSGLGDGAELEPESDPEPEPEPEPEPGPDGDKARSREDASADDGTSPE